MLTKYNDKSEIIWIVDINDPNFVDWIRKTELIRAERTPGEVAVSGYTEQGYSE